MTNKSAISKLERIRQYLYITAQVQSPFAENDIQARVQAEEIVRQLRYRVMAEITQ